MGLSTTLYESVLSSILENRFPGIQQLSAEQNKALFGLLNREDVFAILPTGHGKSLIFQCLPDFCHELFLRGLFYPRNAIIIVVCPLNSLVNSHIRELQSRGITATSLVGEDVEEEKILRGEYSFVFANPESLLQNEKWRKMLQSEVYKKNVFAMVTDEAHVIPKWGFKTQKQNKSKKEFVAAFRECFSRLGELRSLLNQKPLVPVLALTATANIQTRKSVEESLCLRKNYVKVFISPNRENIYLNKLRVTSNVKKTFQWLVEKVREEKVFMDKTIVYCKSIRDCGRLFMFFKTSLGIDSFFPNYETTSKNLIFAMYHHSTLAKNQARTLESFLDGNGTCRLIFATNALGMGVNFPNVRTIIHYGPPKEMEELVQQSGRAGRDGQPAVALILYNGQKIRYCEQDVKDLCIKEGCLREMLLSNFGIEEVPNFKTHNCCINCHKECMCMEGKSCNVNLPQTSEDQAQPELKTRTVTKENLKLLEEILQEYTSELSPELLCFMGVDGTHLFSDTLTKKVLKQAKFIFDKEYILDNLPVFKNEHAMDILCMINDVFEDIDEEDIDVSQCSSPGVSIGNNCELNLMDMCQEFLDDSSEEYDEEVVSEDDFSD